jgi:hypothetical protein
MDANFLSTIRDAKTKQITTLGINICKRRLERTWHSFPNLISTQHNAITLHTECPSSTSNVRKVTGKLSIHGNTELLFERRGSSKQHNISAERGERNKCYIGISIHSTDNSLGTCAIGPVGSTLIQPWSPQVGCLVRHWPQASSAVVAAYIRTCSVRGKGMPRERPGSTCRSQMQSSKCWAI